jgi:hypothetical protein
VDIGNALELPACHNKVLCLGEKGARISACMVSDIAVSDTGSTYCAEEAPSSSNLDSVPKSGSY